ncbi:ATP-binding protein [uncultured Ruminococcus sp.]|uniref:ATP-binding protein n=1 Tax=uncultured Ruminococcus sp. TaxID=165186 RepID=UPI00292E5CAC|nr:ATP-binding protein [uncultured Ruminococcus sp.]
MKRLEIPAEKARLSEVLDFVLGFAEELGFGKAVLFQLKVCTEEIFVNVASYAYAPDTGMITVTADGSADPLSVTLSFIDSGTPFDPLSKPDPAKFRPFSQAKKGGLGIFITKKLMDEVNYAYQDGRNILTIRKTIAGNGEKS